ncbi:MarR family transcriptional regulator [Fischerella thermalis]|uniref:MarR family transcriptional regulator n=1 Tax=Fischerella thermalis TaxID=372787 RepID=UPI000C80C227|nr:helix-turn-helix domain-containing protein [Fischerella thermalis]MBF1990815.1 MarR family transcriptional regulator [Fischerella thermalis M58_A2018_009]MBF2061291.1 MarR family transcriptional regulator [Fischerella thermalis M66_A2018_004]PLZ91817.1 MarR family transcriptional regulator [Fischerella thermalis CCMEE 5194]
MTQSNPKIQGKFYPLQHEEWLRACRELTPAQRDVLYYIRTIDPYNQGIVINAAEVARQLSGAERIVHRQTVSRALKELDVKGFIDLELLQVRTKVKPKGLWCDDAPEVCEDTNGVMTHRARSLRTTVDHHAPRWIVTHHAESESLVESEFQNPKINKTYLDFIKTLSEDERANFLNFCEQLTSNLSQPVNDIEAWLAHQNKAGQNRWEVYYKKFLGWQQAQSKKSQNGRGSQMMKKFQQEIEEQLQQAMETYENQV